MEINQNNKINNVSNLYNLLPGTKICGKYVIEQLIGKGSFGTIYQAKLIDNKE